MNKSNLPTNVICIVCPKGCHLQIDKDLNVTGNSCSRGKKYGFDEITNPTRMITSTVTIKNGEIARLPVITSAPIPKDKIFAVMDEINNVVVLAPVKLHDIIIENVLNLGINVVATRTINKK